MDILKENPMSSPASTASFTIRLANIHDIPRITDLHLLSFQPEEHVPVMLGKQYVQATYRWIIAGGESYALLAEADDKILGFIGVCDGPFTRAMFFSCLPEFFMSLIRSPNLIFQKELWKRLLRRPHLSASGKHLAGYPGFAQMTIGAVGVRSRGMGIFPALVDATKEISKTGGSRAIRAGVYKTNQSSRRVFLKANWIEAKEFETSDTIFYVHFSDPSFPLETGINATSSSYL